MSKLRSVFLGLALGSVLLFSLGHAGDRGTLNPQGTPILGSALDDKIDPGLRYMLGKYTEAQASTPLGKVEAERKLFDGSLYFSLDPGVRGYPPRAQVFVKLHDRSALSQLSQHGFELTTVVGDIALGWIPIDRSYDLASLSSVVSVQISGRSRSSINVSRSETRVDQLHGGVGGTVYKGKGVVLGVLDSGIDWRHLDFSVGSSNTRILHLLDFGNAGASGAPTEFTKTQIDGGQCTERDGNGSGGHGTHVAGIAAGGGRRNAAYIGMAPESDIVFVKGIRDPDSDGGFSDADVVTGVQFIFNKAQALNKPAVANLSLGGHFGPHDGTSLYEQSLSSLVRPGNIIVAAAGNEGSDYIHASFAAEGTSYQTATEIPWLMETGEDLSAVDLWYPASGSMSVGIGVYAIQGSQLTPLANTTPVAPGQSIANVVLKSTAGETLGTATVDARTTQDPNNGLRNVFVVVQGSNIANYSWTVYAFGSGTMDMWVAKGGKFLAPTGGLPAKFRFGDNNKSVGMPATAKKVVCVGSHVTKNQWASIDGKTYTQVGAVVGNLSTFSSLGPSRDGRVKPDFTAPGEAVMAALSSDYTNVEPPVVLQGGGLQKMQGTSMASPHVAGIVALMLQKNRYLTYDNVVTLLSGTARPTGGNPNNSFGAGKVDALAAVNATPPSVDCATLARVTGVDCDGNRIYSYALLDAYPNPFNPATTLSFSLEKPERAELIIFDVLGKKVRTLVDDVREPGLHHVLWDGKDSDGKTTASGVYFARLLTPSFYATNRLLLTK